MRSIAAHLFGSDLVKTFLLGSFPVDVVSPITSARSTKLNAEYSHEDSGSSVARGEEGGIV